MLRKFRALGLSVVAVLAMSSMAASAAQAEGKFVAGAYPATLEPQGPSVKWAFGNGARFIQCGTENQAGTIGAATATVNITASYGGCISNGLASVPVTIATNGCTYLWSVATLTTGTESVNCPAGQAMLIQVYENAKKQSEGKSLCEYTIAAQGPSGSVGFKNLGSGSSASVERSANVALQATTLKGGLVACGGAAGSTINVSKPVTNTIIAKSGGQVGLAIE